MAAELDAATLTVLSATDETPIVPEVIDTAAALTAATGTDYSESGKFVRLNGVTTAAWASNKSVLTLDTATITAYAGYSGGHDALGENRTQIATAMAALATSGDTFDIMGVLYSANADGVWNLGFPTVNYIVAGEPEPEALVLPNGETFVIFNSAQDLVVAPVPTNEDGWYGYAYPSVPNWNGDDAVALVKNENVIDLIGIIGVDPGSEWTGTGANAVAGSTKDKTLVRADSVVAPNATFTWNEWNVFDNQVSTLGAHTMTGTASDLIISEYTEGATGSNKYLEIYNGTGAEVDLTGYAVSLYSNGAAAATQILDLSTMIHVVIPA